MMLPEPERKIIVYPGKMPSPIRWWGGKSRSLKYILPLIAPHTCYVEVFGGAGWVLFAKELSSVEVYNDIDGRLVNFWLCAKYHPKALGEEIRTVLHSREMFEMYQQQIGETCLQKAARFYFLLKQSFVAKMKNFGYGKAAGGANSSWSCSPKLEKILCETQERLKHTQVEQLDFVTLLSKYDSKDTFFYVDPPYLSDAGEVYKYRFGPADHIRLKYALKGVKGKWLLSYNDCEPIRRNYRDYYIKAIQINVIKGAGKAGKSKELLIANYPIK